MKATRDNPVLGKVKHRAVTVLKVSDPVARLIREMAGNVIYQPRPKRAKFFLIAKAAVPAFIAGRYIRRRRRRSSSQD